MNEAIDNIINKFVNYKIRRSDLEEVAPFIGTEEFNEHYQLVEDVNSIFQEEGRNELRNELKSIIDIEKKIENQKFVIWTGSGCHAKHEKIKMYNGTIKEIQDIEIGEKVLLDKVAMKSKKVFISMTSTA